jgi:phosphate transport system permease protein
MSIPENSSNEHFGPGRLPQGDELKKNIARRKRVGRVWRNLFFSAIIVAIIALVSLMFNIVNESFGLVAVKSRVAPSSLADQPLSELSAEELSTVMFENQNQYPIRTAVVIDMLGIAREDIAEYRDSTIKGVFGDEFDYPEGIGDQRLLALEPETYQEILAINLSAAELNELVIRRIVQPEVDESWNLVDTLTRRSELEDEYLQTRGRELQALQDDGKSSEYQEEAAKELSFKFRSWVSTDFIESTYSTRPDLAGIRTALFGSIYMIIITIVVAFPLGVGAAIYLEEYANDNHFNRLIKVNISNLAGVPSIVYGMLGLVIFVRYLSEFTSGAFFTGEDGSNGSTIMSAGLTMALLILPIIIINAQEAIRAVPSSLRQASYGLGATKWQTVWHHVLPNSMPGIMTGTILALSRAIGETAPLIVVGAATRINVDPSGPFSKFTVLPIQIFHWTGQPEAGFQNTAAAAILVLLAVLLTLNSTAIILRNRFSRRI